MIRKLYIILALLLAIAQGAWAFSGSGTSESPYLIASASDWSTLASNVNSGTNYVGKFFRLTNDISVTTMVGSSEKPFRGTFDGYGHTLTINYNTTSDYTAPFRYIQGATFKNLKVTGSITTTMNLAAGIAGLNTGATATFEQCVTDIIINSSSSTVVGWGRYDYHGGLLARTIDVDAMITDCVCGGSVNGSSSSNSNCASFVGVAENCTVHATRCLSTTSYTNVNKWNSLSHCADNAYRAVNVFYYVNANDAANVGEQVTTSQLADGTITTALQAGRATTVWTQYAAISQPMLRLFALNQANDGYYLIDSEQDWRNFASLIQTTPTANARMTADISVTTMVGSSDKPFSGTFDGQGHTLTFTKGSVSEPFAENSCAPFRHIKNATITNLYVAGTIYTSAQKASGLVADSHGALTITGCRSSVSINSSKSGDGTHGGLVAITTGSGNNVTIGGCVFDGSFATTSSTNSCGGFVGWTGENAPAITNSLMKPGYIAAGMLNNTFARWQSGYEPTITNCYYVATDNLPTDQGKQARSISAGDDVTISNLGSASATYDVSGITAYSHGIKYNDIYYAGDGEAVSLNLSHGDKAGYTFNQYTVTGGGSLGNPTTNTPTLTMTDADQTINAEWLENTATLTDGDDVATALSAWAGKTCTVTYTRSFTADKPSTVCLPFAYTKKTGDGSFYEFTGIEKVDNEYIATMTEPGTSTLTANTPYLYKAATTGDADFSGIYAIPASITAGSTTSGDWTFIGTYSTIEWTDAPTEPTYGFSAQAANDGITQGQFVKVGGYVRIKPMRAYLQYTGSDSQFANARAAAMTSDDTLPETSDDTLPETIGVRLISANGEVTAIGTLYTRTGEVSFDSEAWYTLDGKRLNAKPNTKGIYVNNGKKVVIK